MKRVTRRDFLKLTGAAGGALFLGMSGGETISNIASHVALVKTENRKSGVKASLRVLHVNPVRGKDALIKPNFNCKGSGAWFRGIVSF
jgi:anaerobic selenocysteine-containing dehydrogenase